MDANAGQAAYWNEQAGPTWAQLQPLLDRQIEPLGRLALNALALAPGERVLDIGCGCGDTTLDIARRVAPGGTVLGLDLSAPMLSVAKARAAGLPGVSFLQADAQTYGLDGAFDAAASRFGVMFFADPVAAFTNLRAALRPGGRLGFVCWRAAAENPWMMVPLQAALAHVPLPAPGDPTEPGPFALADRRRIETILDGAGFTGITITAADAQIGGLALPEALHLALTVGPLGKILREAPEHRATVTDAVRAGLAPYEGEQGVFLGAGVWVVTARRGA
jgi:SAM-dependent methyltransferase